MSKLCLVRDVERLNSDLQNASCLRPFASNQELTEMKPALDQWLKKWKKDVDLQSGCRSPEKLKIS